MKNNNLHTLHNISKVKQKRCFIPFCSNQTQQVPPRFCPFCNLGKSNVHFISIWSGNIVSYIFYFTYLIQLILCLKKKTLGGLRLPRSGAILKQNIKWTVLFGKINLDESQASFSADMIWRCMLTITLVDTTPDTAGAAFGKEDKERKRLFFLISAWRISLPNFLLSIHGFAIISLRLCG